MAPLFSDADDPVQLCLLGFHDILQFLQKIRLARQQLFLLIQLGLLQSQLLRLLVQLVLLYGDPCLLFRCQRLLFLQGIRLDEKLLFFPKQFLLLHVKLNIGVKDRQRDDKNKGQQKPRHHIGI